MDVESGVGGRAHRLLHTKLSPGSDFENFRVTKYPIPFRHLQALKDHGICGNMNCHCPTMNPQ